MTRADSVATFFQSKRICLTADDYGLSPGINASIEALAEARAITAASIMAHRDADWSTLDRLAKTPIALGLHLCFTGERPLQRSLGERFPRDYPRLFAALATKPSMVADLADEAESQYDRLQRAGISIAFLNAHEHVHLFPPLWRVFAEMAKRKGIAAIRVALGQPLDFSKSGALAMASRVSFRLSPLRDLQILSPLGVGLAGALSAASVEALLDRPFRAQHGVLPELCIHPALDASPRRAAHELVASGALARLLNARGLTAMRGVSRPLTSVADCG